MWAHILLIPLAFAVDTNAPPSDLSNWSCGQERWVGSPDLKEGVFHSTLETDCEVTNGSKGLDLYHRSKSVKVTLEWEENPSKTDCL